MGWFGLTLIAAVFLGIYDIVKKQAVDNNAVQPVLFLNVLTGALIWSGPIILGFAGFGAPDSFWTQLASPDAFTHGLLLLKAIMVGASWMCAFVALKHLPISTATTIRATSPMWTIFLAIIWLNESLNVLQWLGVAMILGSFFGYSLVSRKEGIVFHRNSWVGLMVLATLISAFCGIYDKFLLQTRKLQPSVVQAWFAIYLVPVMLPQIVTWRLNKKRTPFQWRWTIPMIAVFLLLADIVYFTALADPKAMIALVSPLRRTSVFIPFVFGILWLSEKHWRSKMYCVIGILAGVYLIGISKP